MQLKVVQATVLKPGTAPVTELPRGQVISVGAESSFSLLSYREEGDHLLVEFDPTLTDLASLHPSGRGKWYVPRQHVIDPQGYGEGLRPVDTPSALQARPGDAGDRGFRFTLPGIQGVVFSNDPAHPATPHITWRELLHFDPQGNYRHPADAETVQHLFNLAKTLQEIRNRFGKPLHIISGYRSPEVNAQIGGSPESRHLIGDGADFIIQGVRPAEVYADLDIWWAGRGGLASAPDYTHIDCRGTLARWLYAVPSRQPAVTRG